MSAAAEKALRQIMSLSKRAEFVSGREIRYFELALEGLGMAPALREMELHAVLQKKRERIEAHQAARQVAP